ncbi:hypothetical protein BY996DRAFT_3984081 [Phakopsora pachyrhizi]|uniref:Expressed protein n=1 Tax=Phakopsora pachyrhizi TaxID=170000 RepID=A0AAV0BUV6_PHAPC|nr:hypothetical protein BY996DRAFT_3984081 [Phakopsora pachyrhizi]CAH7689384.1 expressed protein [Phakopsora pachyrhizi]
MNKILKGISLFFAVYVFFIQSALAEDWFTCSGSLEYYPNSGTWICGELYEAGIFTKIVTFRSILGACVDVMKKERVPTKSSLGNVVLPYTFNDCSNDGGKTTVKIDKQVTGYFFQEKHLIVSTTSRGVKSEFKCKKESNIGMIMKCDSDKSKY